MMEDLIKRAEKIQGLKKRDVPKTQYVSSKQFNSFIDRSYENRDCIQPTPFKQQSWAIVREIAESSMRELREMLKSATKEEQIVLNELIELKLKEFDIIFNYIKHR